MRPTVSQARTALPSWVLLSPLIQSAVLERSVVAITCRIIWSLTISPASKSPLRVDMRQYVYAIIWGALIGVLVYACLDFVKFKNNTVKFIVSVIFGVSVFTMVGLQVERFLSTSMQIVAVGVGKIGSTVDGNTWTLSPSEIPSTYDIRFIASSPTMWLAGGTMNNGTC